MFLLIQLTFYFVILILNIFVVQLNLTFKELLRHIHMMGSMDSIGIIHLHSLENQMDFRGTKKEMTRKISVSCVLMEVGTNTEQGERSRLSAGTRIIFRCTVLRSEEVGINQ